MGFFSAMLGNAGTAQPSELQAEYGVLLAQGEAIEIGFKLMRDVFIFTNKRLILVDKQGLTAKRSSTCRCSTRAFRASPSKPPATSTSTPSSKSGYRARPCPASPASSTSKSTSTTCKRYWPSTCWAKPAPCHLTPKSPGCSRSSRGFFCAQQHHRGRTGATLTARNTFLSAP